jgi:glycosyltransferase involved in cell wall biosynthesis
MHDYRLLCPVNTFYLRGEICEACKNQRFYHAIAKRCYQGSLIKSTILSTGAYFTKYIYNYDQLITQYIAPGKFLREKMIEFGYSPDKITVLNNAYFGSTHVINSNNRSYILYVGRLAKHKGVDLLIAVASNISIPVLIVGDGPERPNLESLANRMGAKQVRFLGFQPIEKVNELYCGASLTVIPSRWYENGPLVILESYANGTPVIGAHIGAIPEFIEEGKSGYLFEANSAESLQQVLQRALTDPTALQRMGAYAKKMVRERYSPELYAQKIERILENVI